MDFTLGFNPFTAVTGAMDYVKDYVSTSIPSALNLVSSATTTEIKLADPIGTEHIGEESIWSAMSTNTDSSSSSFAVTTDGQKIDFTPSPSSSTTTESTPEPTSPVASDGTVVDFGKIDNTFPSNSTSSSATSTTSTTSPTFGQGSDTTFGGDSGGEVTDDSVSSVPAKKGYNFEGMKVFASNVSALSLAGASYLDGGLYNGAVKPNDRSETQAVKILSTYPDCLPPGRARMLITGGSTNEWYQDFFLEQYSVSHTEKYHIMETFSVDIVSFFGSRPVMFSISGTLYDTDNLNWAINMESLYNARLKGTAALSNKQHIIIYAGRHILEGYIMNFNLAKSASTPLSAGFSMQILRAQYMHTNTLPLALSAPVRGTGSNVTTFSSSGNSYVSTRQTGKYTSSKVVIEDTSGNAFGRGSSTYDNLASDLGWK